MKLLLVILRCNSEIKKKKLVFAQLCNFLGQPQNKPWLCPCFQSAAAVTIIIKKGKHTNEPCKVRWFVVGLDLKGPFQPTRF